MSESAEYYGMRPNAPVKVGHFRMFETNIFVPCGPSSPLMLHRNFDAPAGAWGEGPDGGEVLEVSEKPRGPQSEEDLAREQLELLREEGQRIRTEARQEAEKTLAEARQRAEEGEKTSRKLLEDARRQTEEIEARAYQAGFEQGEEAGRTLGEQKADLILKSLRSMVEAAVSQREALLKASEQDLVKTALLIALQLIHREIRQEPGVVLDMVRAALSKVRKASRVTVQVSPQDFKFLEERIEQIRSPEEGGMTVQVEQSEEVGRGGCRILSDVGEVDARIESVVEAFRRQIWEEE